MSGFDYAQQERRIASLESNRGASLRFGTVTGVDTATGTARVQLPDGDGMVTMPLRVLGRRTLKDKAQALPDIGEPVAACSPGKGWNRASSSARITRRRRLPPTKRRRSTMCATRTARNSGTTARATS